MLILCRKYLKNELYLCLNFEKNNALHSCPKYFFIIYYIFKNDIMFVIFITINVHKNIKHYEKIGRQNLKICVLVTNLLLLIPRFSVYYILCYFRKGFYEIG